MRFLLLFLLCLPAAQGVELEIDGGEIGNALVPYESALGRYSLEYPQHWQYFDLVNTTSFSDPSVSPDEASFFSVLADRFPGIRTLGELNQHLRFFHPDEIWRETEEAGLRGFTNSRSPRIYYLFRGSEDLLSIRYRAAVKEDEALVRAMLRSLKTE